MTDLSMNFNLTPEQQKRLLPQDLFPTPVTPVGKAPLPVTGGIGKELAPTPAFNNMRDLDAAVQIDPKTGRPIANKYSSMVDANGNLLDQYRMGNKIGADIQLDNTAMNALQSRAMSTGPSAWAQMATQNQRLEQQNAMNSANRNAMAQQNRQYGMLAAKGGLSAGQRERMAMQNGRNAFSATQNIANQGMQQRFNIGMQDEKDKLGLLQQLPGMQMNAANFAQQQRQYRNSATERDISNAMKDIQGYNAFKNNSYSDAMKEWAANEASKAQAKAAGGGGKK